MDFEENNFDKIIMEKIASLNKKEKENLLLIRRIKRVIKSITFWIMNSHDR
ncbi:MAG TPA: hypothetical protein VFM28_07250 [Nitrososphaeraceae archaeon]|nr:hypothetical protein [Nitrososphaeraceae archaeon]